MSALDLTTSIPDNASQPEHAEAILRSSVLVGATKRKRKKIDDTLGVGTKPFEQKEAELKERILAEIRERISTPEQWARMTPAERLAFKVLDGKRGLTFAAHICGIKGDPINNHCVHLEFGKMIYGAGHQCLEYKKKPRKPKLDFTELRRRIIKRKSSPEKWARMTQVERLEFKIDGWGLYAINSQCGQTGDPVSDIHVHLRLGQIIYGREHKCLECQPEPELSREEFARIAEKYKPSLYAIALKMTENMADAEDIVHEALIMGFSSNVGTSCRAPKLRLGLRQIVINLCKNKTKKSNGHHLEPEIYGPVLMSNVNADPLRELERRELAEQMYSALCALCFRLRRIIIMREGKGMSYDDIAKKLKVSQAIVIKLLHNARQELRQLLDGYSRHGSMVGNMPKQHHDGEEHERLQPTN